MRLLGLYCIKKKKEKYINLKNNKLLLAMSNKAWPQFPTLLLKHNCWVTSQRPGGILKLDVWTELVTGWRTCLHVP